MSPLLLLVSLAAPQAPDTLRFEEVTSGTARFHAEARTVVAEERQRALMAVVHTSADTAIAWYEELSISLRTDGEDTHFDTGRALGEHFVLHFGEGGRVTTLHAPETPEELETVADLSMQFDDFFLPARPADLRVGTMWVDTLTFEEVEGEDRSISERIAIFTVVRDTVVDGEASWIVDGPAMHRIDSRGPHDDLPGYTLHIQLQGTEANRFVVRARDGLLISRERRSEMWGEMRLIGAEEVVVPLEQSHTGTVRLLR